MTLVPFDPLNQKIGIGALRRSSISIVNNFSLNTLLNKTPQKNLKIF